jgi:hypothetical protein
MFYVVPISSITSVVLEYHGVRPQNAPWMLKVTWHDATGNIQAMSFATGIPASWIKAWSSVGLAVEGSELAHTTTVRGWLRVNCVWLIGVCFILAVLAIVALSARVFAHHRPGNVHIPLVLKVAGAIFLVVWYIIGRRYSPHPSKDRIVGDDKRAARSEGNTHN